MALPVRSLKFWLLLVLATLLVAGALRWWWGPAVPVVRVQRAALTQTVVATGRMMTPQRVLVGNVVVGTVAQVLAREGDAVRAGQVLATLHAEEQRAVLAQAQATLSEAQARVAQLQTQTGPVAEEGVRKAQANLRSARDAHTRTQRLATQGFFSQSALEEADRALKTAQADHEVALAQALANRPQGAEQMLAHARLEQARAGVALASARVAQTAIRASADGTILRRLVEAGDVVALGRQMFELLVTGETQVSVLVDEKNLAFLSPGQTARIAADAFTDRPIAAQVFWIAPLVDALRGTVEVRLRVTEPATFLKPDMTVSAEMIVGQQSDALVLPALAVRDITSTTPWVLTVRDGRAVRVPVKLGLRGEGHLEIVSGLSEGDAVISIASNIQSGSRVRVQHTP